MAAKKIDPELLGFGEEMKERRLRAGLNQAELATLVSVTRSYIGQVERGDTRCRRDFAQRTDKALKCEGALEDAWDELLRETKYPKYFVSFPKAEASAHLLRIYEATLVYGSFQTEAYARTLLVDAEAVTARMRRQGFLVRKPSPMVCVILDETVLYRQVGTRDVMREQLEHLLTLSLREKVYLQAAPIAYYRGVRGSFGIAAQADGSQVVYAEKAFGGDTSNELADLATVNETFLALQASALNVEDTRTLIRKVIDERWT